MSRLFTLKSVFILLFVFLVIILVSGPLAPLAHAAGTPTPPIAAGATNFFGKIDEPVGVKAYNASPGAGDSKLGVLVFFSNLVRLFTIIAGIWVFVNFLLAGWMYIQSAGDSGATKKVYDKFTMSVIGLVIIVASYTLVALVSLVLFGNAGYILNPVLMGAK